MRLSEEHIASFVTLYERHFGIKLDEAKSRAKASELFHLMELVYRPITHRDLRSIRQRRRTLFSNESEDDPPRGFLAIHRQH